MIRILIAFATICFASISFAQIDCRYSCAPECIRLADTIAANCGLQPLPPSHPPVQLYGSDTCSSDLIANVNATTNCSALQGARRTWGVKIQGQCFDVRDMNSDAACHLFRAGGTYDAVGLYNSDTCSSDLVAFVDSKTQCAQLASYVNVRIYGIQSQGQCSDIADSDFNSACERFKAGLLRSKK